MPNTFSMAPGYIARYKKEKGLRKYPFDCFALLRRRLEYLFHDAPPSIAGRTALRDARTIHRWLTSDSVDLVVTSPPYLRVVRYGKYNWIRLWLLGHSVENVDRRLKVEATDKSLRLSDQLNLPAYFAFLRAVLDSISRVVRPGGVAAVIIGDVALSGGHDYNLAGGAWAEIRHTVPFSLVDVVDDVVELSSKVTRIWGGRRGKATKRDRVLVLRRHGGRRVRPRNPREVLDTLLQPTPV